MRLAYIELAGFRGVKGVLRLDVPSGFLIIAGRNGSGKSTICDAICFALTGAIREHGHKEKGESYSDYLWWRGNGLVAKRFVKLGFQDTQGRIHEVTRSDEGIDKTSEEVLRLLYASHGSPENPLNALARTTLLRDEEITSLSVDLPEGDRYRFVRDALGTVDLADVDSKVASLKKLLEERLRGDQKAYDRYREKISDLTTRLSDLRGSQPSSPDDQAAEQEIKTLLDLPDASLTQLIESARRRLVTERKLLDNLHRLSEKIQQTTSLQEIVASKQYSDRRIELEGIVSGLEREFATTIQECENFEAEVQQAKLQEPSRTKLAQLCELGESIALSDDGKCPLCGSGVAHQAFDEHLALVRDGIQSASSGLVALISQQREAISTRNNLKAKLESARLLLNQHLAKTIELDSLLKSALDEASTEGISIPKGELSVDMVRVETEKVRDVIRRIENGVRWLESSSVTEMIQSLEAELKDLKQRSNDAYAAVTRSEKATTKVKDAQKIAKSLLGEIIDEQLAELSPMIEELYKRLRPHVEWTQIRYRLRGDVKRMLSFEVGEGLNPSFVFSSGQRRAAGLAFLLAVHLSRPWCKLESLILDDPVQHVDDFRALNLTELLTSIRKEGRQILCCVEDEALGHLMCRRLRSGLEADGRFIRLQYDCEAGVIKVHDIEIGPSFKQILVPA